MREETKKRKLNLKNILVLILILISLPSGNVLFVKGLKTPNNQLSYQENGDITYKVFLNKNDFFESSYIDMNKVYITSLINYIDTNFNYNLVFDKPCSGSYTYAIKGLLSADTTNNDNYWTKEYQLTDYKTEKFTDKNVITFNKNIKVKYQKYNDLLMSFKQEYGLTMEGKLKVYLEVTTTIDNDEKPIVKKSNAPQIEVPLTKATIEVPIELTKATSSGNLIVTKENTTKYDIYRYAGIVITVIGLIATIYLVISIAKSGKREYAYVKKIRKILKNYDGIIVNVNELPNIDNLPVTAVENFEELLDAHSEVRLPINYSEEEDIATFLLIGENMAWKYIIEKDRRYK